MIRVLVLLVGLTTSARLYCNLQVVNYSFEYLEWSRTHAKSVKVLQKKATLGWCNKFSHKKRKPTISEVLLRGIIIDIMQVVVSNLTRSLLRCL